MSLPLLNGDFFDNFAAILISRMAHKEPLLSMIPQALYGRVWG